MLSKEELQRYNRHIILNEVGIQGQQKLKTSRVLVIGAGGLGCPVLQYLSAAGVGNIGIIDGDKVSISNLQRQILYNSNDIGSFKAEKAAERLLKQNPHTNFSVYKHNLSKSNALELFEEYDLIIDGSDNIPTRLLINDACLILNKPFVFGAIYKFSGQVSVFNYNNGPSYRCLFPESDNFEEIPDCSTIGVIGVIPGIIGLIQATEAVKIIIGKGDVLSGKLFQIDTLNLKTELISFGRSKEFKKISELGEYGETCSLQKNYDQTNSITAQELKNKLDKKEELHLVDLRNKDLFDNYNIGGSSIDMEKVLFDPAIIPYDIPVVIICEIGEKSLALTEYLQNTKKYSNVYNLHGGIQAWMEKGFDIYI